MKGGRTSGGRSEHGQRRKAAQGTAAGHEPHTGMMILASAMRHSVGRPAHGNGGRHEKSYGAALPAAV